MSVIDEIRIRIKNRRKQLGLTLDGLAMLSDSSKSYIWEIERGAVRPSVIKIIDIAKGLHCTVGYLVGEEKLTGDIEINHQAKKLITALQEFVKDE